MCQFTLSWLISDGEADGVDLGDRAVVMAGWYDDDEEDTPIRVTPGSSTVTVRAIRCASPVLRR